MTRAVHIILALLPVLLTPVFIYLLAEGILAFGGGEKDLILVLPWSIWSVAFAVSAFVLIYRRWNLIRWVVCSAIIATIVLVILGVGAHIGGFLGLSA